MTNINENPSGAEDYSQRDAEDYSQFDRELVLTRLHGYMEFLSDTMREMTVAMETLIETMKKIQTPEVENDVTSEK